METQIHIADTAVDTDTRRQVYVNALQIFEQEKSERGSLTKGRIKKLVKTKESLQPLRARMGHANLVSLLRSMVDEGIFDSKMRAWREFPELFPCPPPLEPDDGVVDLNQHVAVAEDGQDSERNVEEGVDDDLTDDDDLDETTPASAKDTVVHDGTSTSFLFYCRIMPQKRRDTNSSQVKPLRQNKAAKPTSQGPCSHWQLSACPTALNTPS